MLPKDECFYFEMITTATGKIDICKPANLHSTAQLTGFGRSASKVRVRLCTRGARCQRACILSVAIGRGLGSG